MRKPHLIIAMFCLSFALTVLAGCQSSPEPQANAQPTTQERGANTKKLGKLGDHLGPT